MNREINKYIETRYYHWLEYAVYHCAKAKIPDEANDVLNEVIFYLLKKDESRILQLLHSTNEKYTELDQYVLKMIKLNSYSATSPYRNKYKPIPADRNINVFRLKIEDISEEQDDEPAEILNKFHQVRDALESLNLSAKAKQVFEFRFFEGLKFSDWPGDEPKKELYDVYLKVVRLIRAKIKKETLL